MALSGRVHTFRLDQTTGVSFPQYSGSLAVSATVGSHSINFPNGVQNGQLSIEIGTSSPEWLSDITSNEAIKSSLALTMYDELNFSEDDANVAVLELMTDEGRLSRYYGNVTVEGFTNEGLTYIYVDKDVTITGKGKPIYDNFVTADFTLELKHGWNTVLRERSGNDDEIETLSVGNNTRIIWVVMQRGG